MHLFFKKIGEETFHADQIMKWIYCYYCDDFDKMTNIKKILRLKLKNIAEIHAPNIIDQQKSSDGTIKWIFNIDNQYIETVYIPEINRSTICISSQIGCSLKCTFCSTARQGFSRNLRVSEIIGQIWQIKKIVNNFKISNKRSITNVVIMGMGEPLLNLNNLVSAIKIMQDSLGFGLSKRHITLSTVGITPAINKLSNLIDIGLAISLHAPNNKIRSQIIPMNKKYNIESLFSSIKHYLKKSKANRGHVTIEYIMLNNINDSNEHAHELAMLLKLNNIPCKINLIPWNKFPKAKYNRSSNKRIYYFSKILINYGFITTVRKNRGEDIHAACGQLVGKVINKNKNIMLS